MNSGSALTSENVARKVGDALAERLTGFRWLRSRRALIRVEGLYRFEVTLSTHRREWEGRPVISVLPAALVRSREFGKWRAESLHESEANHLDLVAGGLFHRLQVPHGWPSDYEYDIDDISACVSVAHAIAGDIVEIALPFFAFFGHADRLERSLAKAAPPTFEPAQAVRWLMWRGRPEIARAHTRMAVAGDERFRRRFSSALAEFRTKAQNSPPPDYAAAEALAYWCTRFDLQVPTT